MDLPVRLRLRMALGQARHVLAVAAAAVVVAAAAEGAAAEEGAVVVVAGRRLEILLISRPGCK
jgi:hypothetical protein